MFRIIAGGFEGWGECEASPLTSIASYVCPMSHSACKPLKYSLEGKSINSVKDIQHISSLVHENSMDLLQANHTLSGIDIALWDILGKKLNEPVFKLLGYKGAFPKLPYASQLFGDTPEETLEKAKRVNAIGYKAVKFGWGSFGKNNLNEDIAHLLAAREGIGKSALLMIDAGTAWGYNVSSAKKRLSSLQKVNTYWLEEPFVNGALDPYKKLSKSVPNVALAGGEGCNNYVQAQGMMQHAGLKFIQIDAGRIGGITVAKQVVDLAQKVNIAYVNHTFTSHLALSASLQPYAGIEEDFISEYPVELSSLAQDISQTKIVPDTDGYIHVPESPGLGISVNTEILKKYLMTVEININGKQIYYTPEF